MILTTQTLGGFEISETLAVVSAQCAFAPRVFSDACASVQAVVDRRVGSIEKVMQDGVDEVLDELKNHALALGADAVIAITIQYTPIGSGTSNQTLISGMGTAVRLKT